MRHERLARCCVAEAVPEGAGALGEVGRPHLQEGIPEAEFEDRARDDRPHRDIARLDLLPDLLAVAHRETAQHRGLARGESHAAVHTHGLEEPGVDVSGRDPTCLPKHGEVPTRPRVGGAGEQRVVPGVADDGQAVGTGTLGDDVIEARVHRDGIPAKAQRHVRDMQAEVAHDPDLAACLDAPLPVDGLVPIDIRGVPEAGAHVQDIAERTGCRVGVGALRPGIEGELARHTHEGIGALDGLDDATRGGQVDPEGLLAEEVAPRRNGGHVDLLVQLVGHGDIEHVDAVVLDELAPVVREAVHRIDAGEPLTGGRRRIRHGDDARLHGMVDEQVPASAHGDELASHEAAPDDADAHLVGRAHDARRISRARCASAPSWSIAMSARVIPAGLSCWMMLRP